MKLLIVAVIVSVSGFLSTASACGPQSEAKMFGYITNAKTNKAANSTPAKATK